MSDTVSDTGIWVLIVGLGLVTYAIRLSFLGLLAGRTLPPLLMEALSFVPVTVLPALVAPMVLWVDGSFATDTPRMAGALVGLVVGAWVRHVFAAIAGAMATFATLSALGL
ncbi:MAG: AzlD domain-containing protein [Pseudomonadota bacterium]